MVQHYNGTSKRGGTKLGGRMEKQKANSPIWVKILEYQSLFFMGIVTDGEEQRDERVHLT